ncbi:hypothetical protein BJ912DRAFT_187439 [Pholiota molesta]|nr:hypothetical protein BJ912DRAFT_187439 [Pholiota molesta]
MTNAQTMTNTLPPALSSALAHSSFLFLRHLYFPCVWGRNVLFLPFCLVYLFLLSSLLFLFCLVFWIVKSIPC